MPLFGKLFSGSKKTPSSATALSSASKETTNNLVAFIRTMKDDLAALEGEVAPVASAAPKPANPFLAETQEQDKAPAPQKPVESEIQLTQKPEKKQPSLEHIVESLSETLPKPAPADTQAEDYAYEENKSLSASPQPTDAELLAAEKPAEHLNGLPGSYAESYPEIVTYQKKGHPILVAFLVILFASAGGGAYYWWKIYRPAQFIANDTLPTPTQPSVPEPTPKEEEPTTPDDQTPSTPTGPKQLTLDPKTVTALALRASLVEAGKTMTEEGSTALQEFTVIDTDGQAVAFSQFAQWLKINIPPQTLASLEAPFTLFLYNDSGDIRVGFALTPKEVSKTKSLLTIIEPQLLRIFSPIFLDIPTNTTLKTTVFSNSSYNNYSIRYANVPTPIVDTVGSLSIDYAFSETKLFIGTSKQTSRAILDWNDRQASVQDTEKSAE